MHILNLGILQNVCAEGILWLMEHNVFCDGITAAADKLRLVFNEFKRYCKIHGISCSQRTFTPANLHYATGADKQTDYPFLSAKAYNCRVVLAWLADCWLAL